MLIAEKVRSALEALAPNSEKVDLAVKAAIEVANPSRVIVFGSWARGESKWDSDVDLAVVMPDSAESRLSDLRRDLRRKLDEVPMTIDLVLTTESCVNRFRDSINSIYYHIIKDGKVAYEQRPAHTSANPTFEGR